MIYPKFERSVDKELFEKELDCWGVRTFNDHLEEKRLRTKLPRELISFLESQPEKAHEMAQKKWDELGPLNLRSIERFSSMPDIDFNRKFG